MVKAMEKVDGEVEEDSKSERGGSGDGNGKRETVMLKMREMLVAKINSDASPQQGLEDEKARCKKKFRKTVAAQQACKHWSSKHTQEREGMGPRLPGS